MEAGSWTGSFVDLYAYGGPFTYTTAVTSILVDGKYELIGPEVAFPVTMFLPLLDARRKPPRDRWLEKWTPKMGDEGYRALHFGGYAAMPFRESVQIRIEWPA